MIGHSELGHSNPLQTPHHIHPLPDPVTAAVAEAAAAAANTLAQEDSNSSGYALHWHHCSSNLAVIMRAQQVLR